MSLPDIIELREDITAEVRGLIESMVESGYDLRVHVTGRSMRPFLKGGEVVTIRPARVEPFGFGQLILVRGAGGTLVLHRVIGRTVAGAWLTKGDGLQAPDAPVKAGDVLGVVVLVQTVPGKIRRLDTRAGRLGCRLAAWRSVTGWRLRRLGSVLKQMVLGRGR